MGVVRNRYVIYYGWLIADPDGTPNGAARAIAAARPGLLLAHMRTFEPRYPNVSEPVRALFRASGTRVMAYVTTSYAQRGRDEVAAEALAQLALGADGVFFDEVANFLDRHHDDYYRTLSNAVRERGGTVVMNTGVAQTGEAIMELADILMVEHQWRTLYRTNPWHAQYPPERFMGDSSNEPGASAPEFLGYPVDRDRGIADTLEAWNRGIGWHYSTNRYVRLPRWFGTYTKVVESVTAAPSPLGRGT